MKTPTLYLVLISLVISLDLKAQSEVNISIQHYLQDQPFALDQPSLTHEGQTFNVTRLEYYLSEFSVTDQNGNSFAPDSIWVLVDASQSTEINLGISNLDSVVSITFHIGVDSAHNHLDPAEWPAEHPLAHKNPSMHWGWANGYRFNAMEGLAGDNLGQDYELHGLGDENYFSVTLDVAAGAENGSITIPIYANYAEVLRGLDVEDGIISHGPIYEAQTSLENMRDYVFGTSVPVSTVDSTTSVGEAPDDNTFDFFPNPVDEVLYFDQPVTGSLIDAMGREVLRFTRSRSADVSTLPTGVYVLKVEDARAERLVIQ